VADPAEALPDRHVEALERIAAALEAIAGKRSRPAVSSPPVVEVTDVDRARARRAARRRGLHVRGDR
jgi:hypothetical protein